MIPDGWNIVEWDDNGDPDPATLPPPGTRIEMYRGVFNVPGFPPPGETVGPQSWHSIGETRRIDGPSQVQLESVTTGNIDSPDWLIEVMVQRGDVIAWRLFEEADQ